MTNANTATVEIFSGFPIGLLLFSAPAVGYVFVHRWRGAEWEDAFRRVGWLVAS